MNAKKLTGAELARRAKLSKDAISSYTTMRSLPTPKTLATLAKILECKPTELLPDTPVKQSIVEVRDYDAPGFKLLVVRLPLPLMKAMEYCGKLSALEQSEEVAKVLNRDVLELD
jgi:transcriptional regulator with XRE-family HTH domain